MMKNKPSNRFIRAFAFPFLFAAGCGGMPVDEMAAPSSQKGDEVALADGQSCLYFLVWDRFKPKKDFERGKDELVLATYVNKEYLLEKTRSYHFRQEGTPERDLWSPPIRLWVSGRGVVRYGFALGEINALVFDLISIPTGSQVKASRDVVDFVGDYRFEELAEDDPHLALQHDFDGVHHVSLVHENAEVTARIYRDCPAD